MGAAIGLRDDFDAAGLRRLARTTKSANQGRRLLALAEIYDGANRSDAARIGGVTLKIVRDWVVRFNARGPAGLLDGKAPGKPPLLNDIQRQALAEVVESGPIPAIHGVVRWRLIDLARWLHDEFGVSLAAFTAAFAPPQFRRAARSCPTMLSHRESAFHPCLSRNLLTELSDHLERSDTVAQARAARSAGGNSSPPDH